MDKVSQEQRPFLIEIERRNGIVKFEEIALIKIAPRTGSVCDNPVRAITLAKEGEQDGL